MPYSRSVVVTPPSVNAVVRLRVLGADVPRLPEGAGAVLADDRGAADALAIVAPVSEDAIRRQLAAAGLAAPLLDFTGAGHARADFVAPHFSAEALAAGLAAIRPILGRLAALPDFSASPEREALSALAMAQSRAAPIRAVWAPERKEAVAYPMLSGIGNGVARLEALADDGLLRREFFRRLHLCDRCDSSRLSAEEQCVACASGNLGEAPIVHHYSCGHQAPQPAFVAGTALVCPKCRRELRHFGVDYDKPGSVVVCRACAEAMAEPSVVFWCLDRGHATPGEGIAVRDVHHFHLTEDGLMALESGRMPQAQLEDILIGAELAIGMREFLLLAEHGLRAASRYERPFSVCRLNIANAPDIRQRMGRRAAHAQFAALVEVVRESVRRADFLTARGDAILLAMPETASPGAEIVAERLTGRAAARISSDFAFETAVAEGEAARGVLDSCR